jgi:uncharacterized SAM-binding protein YcdF (DUF218 family)
LLSSRIEVSTQSSTATRQRISDAVIGAAWGVLVAAAIVVSEAPRVTGAHPKLFLLGCAVVGAGLGLLGQLRRAALAAIPVAVIIVTIMTTPIMSPAIRQWIRNDSIPAGPLDAVVVLSASIHADSSLNASGAERLVRGVSLMRATHTPLLITTRVTFHVYAGWINSDAAQRRLVESLTDSVDWRIVGPVTSTRDEAQRIGQLLLPMGKRRIGLVTSPLHTRRGCAVFETAGFQVVCVPSEEWSYSSGNVNSPLDRMRAFFDYVYERIGMIQYRMRGWVKS